MILKDVALQIIDGFVHNRLSMVSGCLFLSSSITPHNLITTMVPRYYQENFHFTQEETDPYKIPTKHNIRMALYWLVQGCQPGDSLVFHYSGHGSQQRSYHSDEVDGYDETLCPLDFESQGMIVDDEINATIVRPLPHGVKLHAIIDACHSGTVLDLPFLCRMNRKWDDPLIDIIFIDVGAGNMYGKIIALDLVFGKVQVVVKPFPSVVATMTKPLLIPRCQRSSPSIAAATRITCRNMERIKGSVPSGSPDLWHSLSLSGSATTNIIIYYGYIIAGATTDCVGTIRCVHEALLSMMTWQYRIQAVSLLSYRSRWWIHRVLCQLLILQHLQYSTRIFTRESFLYCRLCPKNYNSATVCVLEKMLERSTVLASDRRLACSILSE
ncbi:hypothetical protein C4D60_Mb02t18920 [Musa balbisiana]|uniref:Peptidase C14 caspase domain-containing protein n=1 Tax=Musa balbisiana TaxID=52838 RepID=A0A4S8IE43_MUSBA|nr:hypothetical protein C4D60_Mb02t18920 [Musa balbisiana]